MCDIKHMLMKKNVSVINRLEILLRLDYTTIINCLCGNCHVLVIILVTVTLNHNIVTYTCMYIAARKSIIKHVKKEESCIYRIQIAE